MRRKIVKQGAATLMISLPSKWAQKNKLKKGDEVEVEEKQDELVINAKNSTSEKKHIIIRINDENRVDIKNILTHAYRRGFDKIIIEGTDKELLKEIRKIVNNLLLGFELIEKEPNKCAIENISEPIEQKYEVMLKKVFMNIKETQDETINAIKEGKFNLDEAKETKDLHDKFILFCRRLLSKQNGNNLEWELLTFLMHIQHVYYYLYEYAAHNKIKGTKNMIEMLEKTKDYFLLFEDAYYNQNIESVHKINQLKKAYHFGKCIELIEKAKGKEAVVYCYIKESFRLIQIGMSPVLSKILDKTD